MALIIEVLGPPAAGKTTLCQQLHDELPVVPEQLQAMRQAGALLARSARSSWLVP